MSNLKILCIGDVVGKTGCSMVQKHLSSLRSKYKIDAVILNGENSSSQGRGVSPRSMSLFKDLGVDVVTSGNHIWAKRDIIPYLEKNTDLLRPINYPSETPGVGVTTFRCKDQVIGVINVQGQTFMREQVSCPFRATESLLTYLRSKTNIIIVDFHAEATSEKQGLAFFLDGKISALFGTHTHVQTADERILPGGTAYISDLGCVGSLNSMLGMKKDIIIKKFLTQMPVRFEVEETNPVRLCGIVLEIDSTTGKALSIERVQVIDEQLFS